MKVDYIIVGGGLAGVLLCERLLENNKTFVIFDDGSQQSSTVAGGLYNPVILKRFTAVWRAQEQLDLVDQVYKKIERRLDIKLDYKIPVYRRFNSVEEQNNWSIASDRISLSPFLSAELINHEIEGIDAPFGYGKVNHTGRIDTHLLITKYHDFLINNKFLIQESFAYNQLEIDEDALMYKQIEAKHIVFSEGFGLKRNPFFNYLPLNGTKGELLTIHAPGLKLKAVIKSGVFIIPLDQNHFRVGATYNWTDKSNQPTQDGKIEILNKLSKFLECDFEVINHVAGIRPTVKDRRPLVGGHPEHKNLYVLNGMGSRGVMIAPYIVNQLYNNIEHSTGLNSEISIKRLT